MADQNLQHLLHLLERNQVFASFHYLSNLPVSLHIPNRQQLLSDLQVKIDRARNLTSDINTILESGDYPLALSKLHRAQSLVRDFPNIQTDIDFIKASISTMEKNLREAKLLAKKGDKQKVTEILKSVQGIDKNNDAIPEVTKHLSSSRRKKGFKTVLCGIIVMIIPFVYFSFEQLTLQQAQGLWQKADQLIQNQEYKQAAEIITQMDNRLQFVRLFGQAEKVRLLSKAVDCDETILAAKNDTEVNSQGKVSKKANGNKRYVESLLAEAKGRAKAGEFQSALALYDDALSFSVANIHIDSKTTDDIQQRRDRTALDFKAYTEKKNTTTFQTLVTTAHDLFRNDNWLEASTAYKHAMNFGEEFKMVDEVEMDILKKGYDAAILNHNIEEGEIALNQNRYDDAIASFDKCLIYMETEHTDGSPLYSSLLGKLDLVKEKKFNVKLAQLIEYGNELYLDKEYELSVDNYMIGLTLLNSPEAEIISSKKAGLQKSIKRRIHQAQEQILVQTQSQYLVASYKKILRNNFNLSRNIHFKHPEIVFIGNMNNHLIYTVSAFGTKSVTASPIKYEIDYKFNIDTGQWKVNDIRLEV